MQTTTVNSAANSAINPDLMVRLRAKGISVKAIAERFTVPRKVVEETLAEYQPDQKALSFAEKLEQLLIDVPTDYCRKELERSVELIRTHHAVSRFAKRQRIVEAIESGAHAIDEIAEECGSRKKKPKNCSMN